MSWNYVTVCNLAPLHTLEKMCSFLSCFDVVDWVGCFSFYCCLCCCFAQALRNWLFLCNCLCIPMHVRLYISHSASTSGHISCNRPSVKARQLTIRGVRRGDYTRGLVSHTIIHIHWQAWELVCQYCFVAVCVWAHTQGEEEAILLWNSPKSRKKTEWAQTER